MLGLGFLCGAMLSIASKVFYVYEDPRIAEVEGFTALANCGGCGYTGCSAAAAAVVAGKAFPTVCVVADEEAAINIANVMGIDPGTAEAILAYNTCAGGDRADDKYYYMGISNCQALATIYGGQRVCSVGCLGLSDCVRACIFDAIKLGPEGYPVVDEIKCVGCGACERVCPKYIKKSKPCLKDCSISTSLMTASLLVNRHALLKLTFQNTSLKLTRVIMKAPLIQSGSEILCCYHAAVSARIPVKISAAGVLKMKRFPSTR